MVCRGRCVFCTLMTSLSMPRPSKQSWRGCVVFTRLREARLKLSPKKCHLFQKRVVFLGHVVSDEGVSTEPEKIKAVREWPTPTLASALRSFLGLRSYYRRFLRGFANVAAPLHRLTEKRRTMPLFGLMIVMSPSIGSKKSFPKHQCWPTPLQRAPSSLATTPATEGEEKVITCFSRSLPKSQRQHCVTRKELLVTAVRHFRHYVYGRHFKVRQTTGH